MTTSFHLLGMGMTDPKPTFGYLISQLVTRHPRLSYIHVVEPRVDGMNTLAYIPVGRSNDFIREIWESGDGGGERRLISAGGYTRALGTECADKKGDLIAYGRPFIANVGRSSTLLRDPPCSPQALFSCANSQTFLTVLRKTSDCRLRTGSGTTGTEVLTLRVIQIIHLRGVSSPRKIPSGSTVKCDAISRIGLSLL